jgi:hypothetical protein
VHPTLAAMKLRLDLLFSPPAADNLETLPKVGGMASIPTRAADLGRVLAEIVPQVDRLHLFLHGYSSIPQDALHSKIIPYLAPVEHEFRASGKFYGLAQETAPCLYFGFDDDILYKAGHVARLTTALARYRGQAVVGIHGARYLDPSATFNTRRRSYFFERVLYLDHLVDVLGTGTVGFYSGVLSFYPPDWPHGDMDDLFVSIEAERRGLRRIAIRRPQRSIVALATKQADSLALSASRDNTRHTEQLRVLLRLMGKLPDETSTSQSESGMIA